MLPFARKTLEFYPPGVKCGSSRYFRNCSPQLFSEPFGWKPWEDMLDRESVTSSCWFFARIFFSADFVLFWFFLLLLSFSLQWIWQWVENSDSDIVTILKLICLEGCNATCCGRRRWHEGGKRRERGAVPWIRAFISFQKRGNSDV